MSTGFESPSHSALIAEQAVAQADKFQGRLLEEYNDYLFPSLKWREPLGSAVVDFVRPLIGDVEFATFNGVLEGLSETKAGHPVHWVDMGGGRALSMRQLGSMLGLKTGLKMTSVDLFNYGLDGLKTDELEYLENLAPGMTHPEAEPVLIADNVETVSLPEPADIVTSVEVMQYLNNPLGALTNWYNQLADNGLMIVATGHDWASWIRYERGSGRADRDETPTSHLLEELAKHEINSAATYECDRRSGRDALDPSRFRTLAIQKKPGTSLQVTQPVTEIYVNPSRYKAVYYAASTEGSSPIVEAVVSKPYAALGAVTLGATS